MGKNKNNDEMHEVEINPLHISVRKEDEPYLNRTFDGRINNLMSFMRPFVVLSI